MGGNKNIVQASSCSMQRFYYLDLCDMIIEFLHLYATNEVLVDINDRE